MWIFIGILTLLPVWRDPSWEGGKNAWQSIHFLATNPQKEHISVEQALAECRQAYQESLG